MVTPLSWQALAELSDYQVDMINGPTNAQATLRLFGQSEEALRVTLYRDNHGWCPYCQKVWLWLEEKQIPYRIKKVTMFCYGEKEAWYKKLVPSGMLPALELDGRFHTESDDILMALEKAFGPLLWAMEDPLVLPLRKLERLLFRAWCNWLCYPAMFPGADQRNQQQFQQVVDQVEKALEKLPGPYFLPEFSTADIVFVPYVERMSASLFYYKGYSLRENNPRLKDWFAALETRMTYRGTQSDFHTHAHDLPPQMGGCYSNGSDQAQRNQHQVDNGPWFGLPDATYPEPENVKQEAIARVVKHHENIIKVNGHDRGEKFDQALRCALTLLATGEECAPPQGTDQALRYLRDRVNVPRDMSIYAAKHLRQALETTASLVGDSQGEPIPVRHRRDQDPANFR